MSDSLVGCSAAIGTVTQTMKAQKILANAAIPSAVIKYDGTHKSKGCIYGLSFSCAQAGNARTVLEGGGIRVRQWNTQS